MLSFLLLLSFLLCSCASSEDSLKRVTAKETNTRSSEVTVYDIDRGMSNVSWKAKTESGCYECDADDMVRQVHCVKVTCDSLTAKKNQ